MPFLRELHSSVSDPDTRFARAILILAMLGIASGTVAGLFHLPLPLESRMRVPRAAGPLYSPAHRTPFRSDLVGLYTKELTERLYPDV
jgi:hypothetical protein